MNNNEILDRVTGFIYTRFPLAKKRGIAVDDSLLESGVVDSMGILEIVTFIETEYAVELSDEEVLADTFRSITTIAELIESKTANANS